MKKVSVIGGATIDLKAKSRKKLVPETSNIGSLTTTFGGVAFNIADNLAKLNVPVTLFSIVGDDAYGESIREECRRNNISFNFARPVCGRATAIYAALLDASGELFAGISAMDIFDDITEEAVGEFEPELENSAIVVADTNIPGKSLERLALLCRSKGIPLWIEPTAKDKCHRMLPVLHLADYISPNDEELEVLSDITIITSQDRQKACRKLLDKKVKNIIVTCGETGVFYCSENTWEHIPTGRVSVRDVTGAGDSLVAATIWAMNHGHTAEQSIQFGISAALSTIQVYESVNPELSEKLITKIKEETFL